MATLNSSALPEPQFIDCDAQTVTRELIAAWETLAGKTLHPAQIERLWIDQQAYRETLVRIGIQEAAKQNLLAFARAPMLDYLGQFMATPRLAAQPACCTVRVVFAQTSPQTWSIPPGWRIATESGVEFTNPQAVTVVAHTNQVEFLVQAVQLGSAGNGYLPGQIKILRSALAQAVQSAENLSTSCGGSEVEDDARYRERIRLAPETFSWGSAQRYRALALKAAAEVIDVQVLSPSHDGRLDIILLSQSGSPSAETIQRVQTALEHPQARMLGDRIRVLAATPRGYRLQLEIDVLAKQVPTLVLEQARQRLQAWAAQQARRLGGDLVPAQILSVLGGINGIYDVRLHEPTGKQVLAITEWSCLLDLQIELGEVISDA